MQPLFEPGDFVLVNRWAYLFSKPQIGDIAIIRDPEKPDRFLLKRIKKCENDRYWLEGDNLIHSRDSRIFGPVEKAQIFGKMLVKVNKG